MYVLNWLIVFNIIIDLVQQEVFRKAHNYLKIRFPFETLLRD